jgi:hypothetical protein
LGKRLMIIALATSLAVSANLLAGEICFSAATVLPGGSGAHCLYAADLNKDGREDLVVGSFSGDSILIYATNNFGNFRAPLSLPAGYGDFGHLPTCITAGDFDGDGDLDLAFTAYYSGSVGIFRQQPNFTFSSAVFNDCGYAPTWLVNGDLDNDGDLDLACANSESNSISIFKNDSLGTFGPASFYIAGITPHCLALADFDSDGDQDLVTACSKSEDFSVLFNDGNGGFSQRTRYSCPRSPWGVTVGDFDSDGDIDIAGVTRSSGNAVILLNNANGIFTIAASVPVGTGPTGITAADMDNDGDLDLATSNYNDQSQTILLNDGNALFARAADCPIGGTALTIISFDQNGDGLIDLASPLSESATLVINQNRGNATFPPVYSAECGSYVQPIGMLDIDHDYDLDLVLASQENLLELLKNDGEGRLKPAQAIAAFPGTDYPMASVLTDCDGDGDLDLAYGRNNANSLNILINDGSGEFVESGHFSTPALVTQIVSLDADDDGDLDLLTRLNGPVFYLGLLLYLNDGSGNYSQSTHDYHVRSDYGGILVADWNSDGQTDFIVDGRLFLDDPAGGYSERPLGISLSYFFAFADFDNDGDPDIAELANGNQLKLWINDGLGNFAAGPGLAVPAHSFFPVASDFDGDGLVDLGLAGDERFRGISIFQNLGNLTFAAVQGWRFDSEGDYLFGDIDGDGDSDAITADYYHSRVAVRVNCNTPTWSFGDANADGVISVSDAVMIINFVFAGGPAPQPLRRGDINRDFKVNVSDVVKMIGYLFKGEAL